MKTGFAWEAFFQPNNTKRLVIAENLRKALYPIVDQYDKGKDKKEKCQCNQASTCGWRKCSFEICLRHVDHMNVDHDQAPLSTAIDKAVTACITDCGLDSFDGQEELRRKMRGGTLLFDSFLGLLDS
jgi:hypothetical protein